MKHFLGENFLCQVVPHPAGIAQFEMFFCEPPRDREGAVSLIPSVCLTEVEPLNCLVTKLQKPNSSLSTFLYIIPDLLEIVLQMKKNIKIVVIVVGWINHGFFFLMQSRYST